MTIFSSFSANFPLHYHTILAINCVHASNSFIHLQPTRQIDGQNDNFVLTVICSLQTAGRELRQLESICRVQVSTLHEN